MAELLAPAGNYEKMLAALNFGADAIYAAGKSFGLRAFAGNFDNEEIEKATKLVHSLNKKIYITINILAKDKDFEGLLEYVKFLEKVGVDAVIVADIGVISFIRENAPNLNIHVSTQANVLNSYSVNILEKMGVSRIVLAREMSLEDIKQLRQKISKNIELEAFVHGAMCISYSGRCLLSNYMTGRDSNHGACVQACRWKYMIKEVSREDEYEIQEDERGTYILNSKDLCMIRYLKELEKAGVTSFKIEGRMKSEYYVASVTNAYRRAIDSGFSEELYKELEKTSHRRFTTGFYFNDDDKEYLEDSLPYQTHEFAAVVLKDAKDGFAMVEMRNKFMQGDELEVLSPGDEFNKILKVTTILDENNSKIQVVKIVKQKVFIKTDLKLLKGDILRYKLKEKTTK